MTAFLEYGVLQPDEAQQVIKVEAQCFVSSLDRGQVYFDRIGQENFRVVRQGTRVAGSLALIPLGQWWQGKRVPMTGVASVGVSPEYRGTGVAITLMQQMLCELSEQEMPLSVLYPATQRLYRKAGYEQAGTRNSWSVRMAEIQITDRSLPIYPIEPIEAESFKVLQQHYAQRTNGNLDRSPLLWQEILETTGSEPLYAYQIGEPDQPQGYLIFQQHRSAGETILRVQDWAILSAPAGRTLWTLLADHRSMIDKVRWRGALLDPLTLLLPEQSPEMKDSDRWLMRIINVRSALEKRGYPIGVAAELHLEIQDDLLPINTGKFILTVSQGQGEVSSGGRGDMKLSIRGLSPLYSGLFTPSQLQAIGFLDGTESAINAATQIFAGPSPWLPDFF
ncbi:GNAT family N-acetyltransferase [Egbenema bharatensis]|uniref:GNAT family N-acetyltransferase n=1 Tax=Egbenema bharatensis TaxID=3463334 RepID=UPI003A8C00F0